MHSRRARPTLRVLRADLGTGWDSPFPLRRLAEGDTEALHPFAELPHPIIQKASEAIDDDPSADNVVGRIVSSKRIALMEVKTGQWRGAVWAHPTTGTHWLVAAGLAKGDHEDRDDFYERVEREDALDTTKQWLPTAEDERLLKRETASRVLSGWELDVQESAGRHLADALRDGTATWSIMHPSRVEEEFAAIELGFASVREADYRADELLLTVRPGRSAAGSQLLWQLSVRLMVALCPTEQDWDRFGDEFSTIAEPGFSEDRVRQIAAAASRGELLPSEPGTHKHWAHRRGLDDAAVRGTAVRSMCGIYFVPAQDHESKPQCLDCQHRWERLSVVVGALPD